MEERDLYTLLRHAPHGWSRDTVRHLKQQTIFPPPHMKQEFQFATDPLNKMIFTNEIQHKGETLDKQEMFQHAQRLRLSPKDAHQIQQQLFQTVNYITKVNINNVQKIHDQVKEDEDEDNKKKKKDILEKIKKMDKMSQGTALECTEILDVLKSEFLNSTSVKQAKQIFERALGKAKACAKREGAEDVIWDESGGSNWWNKIKNLVKTTVAILVSLLSVPIYAVKSILRFTLRLARNPFLLFTRFWYFMYPILWHMNAFPTIANIVASTAVTLIGIPVSWFAGATAYFAYSWLSSAVLSLLSYSPALLNNIVFLSASGYKILVFDKDESVVSGRMVLRRGVWAVLTFLFMDWNWSWSYLLPALVKLPWFERLYQMVNRGDTDNESTESVVEKLAKMISWDSQDIYEGAKSYLYYLIDVVKEFFGLQNNFERTNGVSPELLKTPQIEFQAVGDRTSDVQTFLDDLLFKTSQQMPADIVDRASEYVSGLPELKEGYVRYFTDPENLEVSKFGGEYYQLTNNARYSDVGVMLQGKDNRTFIHSLAGTKMSRVLQGLQDLVMDPGQILETFRQNPWKNRTPMYESNDLGSPVFNHVWKMVGEVAYVDVWDPSLLSPKDAPRWLTPHILKQGSDYITQNPEWVIQGTVLLEKVADFVRMFKNMQGVKGME